MTPAKETDPVKLGQIEREIKQINPLFALLIEAIDHRAEFEAETDYRTEWFRRVERAIDAEVLAVYRSDQQRQRATDTEAENQAEAQAEQLWARLIDPQTHNAAIGEIAAAPASVRAVIDTKSKAAAMAY